MSLLICSHDIPSAIAHGHYETVLVALSYMVAVIAAYVAIDILQWIRVHDEKMRLKGISVGALVMGVGIWGMHFTGMLAYHMDINHTYDPLLTMLSLVIAFLFSWAVFFNIARQKLPLLRILVSAPLMGAGVAAMHYVGMMAMQVPAEIHYIGLWFWLSILIAVVASGAAMVIMRGVIAVKKHKNKLHVLAALVVGVAVCGMHYTGMAATVIIPDAMATFDKHQSHMLFADVVALVCLLVVFAGYFFLQKSLLPSQGRNTRLDYVSVSVLALSVCGLLFIVHADSDSDMAIASQNFREKSNHQSIILKTAVDEASAFKIEGESTDFRDLEAASGSGQAGRRVQMSSL